MLAVTALLTLSLASSAGYAGDTVQHVAMGLAPGGEQVRLVVWTASGSMTPEGVQLELSAFPGSAAVGHQRIRLDSAKATQQVWLVPGLRFAEDARGDLYSFQVSLWDDEAQLVDQLTVVAGAGGLTEGPDVEWGWGGQASAHLGLDDSGTLGQLGLVLRGPDTPRVTTVSVELQPDRDLARPLQVRHAAHLEWVQQLWIATVDLAPRPGDRYQVDGVVQDSTGHAYGSAFVTQLPVAEHMPSLAPPSPWDRPSDGRMAVR